MTFLLNTCLLETLPVGMAVLHRLSGSSFFAFFCLMHSSSAVRRPMEMSLDLGLQAELRWKHALTEQLPQDFNATKFAQDLKSFYHASVNTLSSESKGIWILASEILERHPQLFFGQEYADEIRSIAAFFDVPFKHLIFQNMVYEFFTIGCTSIVTSNGTNSSNLFLGRNLDFSVADYWRDYAIQLRLFNSQLRRSGSVEIGTITIPALGSISAPTGVANHKFAISLNQRIEGSIEDSLKAFFINNALPAQFLLRSLIQNSEHLNYDSVLAQLKSIPIISPAYYIISGTSDNEGAVISRTRLTTLHCSVLSDASDVWFLVQTNHDAWIDPSLHSLPSDQQSSIDRYKAAVKAMRANGRLRTDGNSVWKILATPPILQQITIASMLLEPNSGNFTTIIPDLSKNIQSKI